MFTDILSMAGRKLRSPSAILSRSASRIVSSSEASFAFFVCLLATTLAYRVHLTIGLFTSPVRPFDFNPTQHPVWFMLAYFPLDLALILLCFLISWFLSQVQRISTETPVLPVLRISGLVLLQILLVTLLLVYGIHGRLLFDVQAGFDTSVIMEALTNVSLHEATKLITIKDALFLLLPIALFWLVLLLPFSLKVWMGRVSLLCFILLSLASLLPAAETRSRVPSEIRMNPALFLLSDIAGNGFRLQSAGAGSMGSVIERNLGRPPADPALSTSKSPLPFLPSPSPHPWNIVLFVMESVGTRYAFDTSHGNQPPMPFLSRMSQEGWYLKRHFTTSNVSTKAMFSLLSGLYDSFGRENFGMRPDASVPAIYNFLPKNYDRFLVTPSAVSWYFPDAFVRNSALPELHSFENLPLNKKEEYNSLGHYIARDEIQTLDFFLQRLANAKEPFMATYISFTAHFPYFDYGPEYRVDDGDGGLLSRYYGNLKLLDQMLKRIYHQLKKQGLLDRTIFVIVGDHGQAFGQHQPNNYMHYRYSYNENLEAPAIIYQPALFRPKVFEMPTSHVDLLPTLLDAMRIPYNPLLFDGESLFHQTLKRTTIFFYGLEDSVSSLDSRRIKVQYSLKKKRCWVFDLENDPDENNPLDCSPYQLQAEALQHFVNDHNSNLDEYNVAIRERRDFQGQRHPSF